MTTVRGIQYTGFDNYHDIKYGGGGRYRVYSKRFVILQSFYITICNIAFDGFIYLFSKKIMVNTMMTS